MQRRTFLAICVALLSAVQTGCMGRIIGEGLGAVTGASGKHVPVKTPPRLSDYHSVQIESITVSPGLICPGDFGRLVEMHMRKVCDNREFLPGGPPALKVRGEVIHYEVGGTVDKAIGPLEEAVIRTQLYDAASGQMLGEANLISRSKATSSSGKENIAEGTGKALKGWLRKYKAGKAEKGEEDEDE